MQDSVHKLAIFINFFTCIVFPFSPICTTVPWEQADLVYMKHLICHHQMTALGQCCEVVEHEASHHLLTVTLAKVSNYFCLNFLISQIVITARISWAVVTTRFTELVFVKCLM